MRPKDAASCSFDCFNVDEKERDAKTRSVALATAEHTHHAALELSKSRWLLAIQFPDRSAPRLYPLKGGDAEGLLAKLDAARDRVAKVTGQTPSVTLCHEAGYDGFWLARLLEHRGIVCPVMEPAGLRVNRRAQRVKTDRIDVENLLHTLIAWCRGERHVCSMVVIPSVEEEDLRRSPKSGHSRRATATRCGAFGGRRPQGHGTRLGWKAATPCV